MGGEAVRGPAGNTAVRGPAGGAAAWGPGGAPRIGPGGGRLLRRCRCGHTTRVPPLRRAWPSARLQAPRRRRLTGRPPITRRRLWSLHLPAATIPIPPVTRIVARTMAPVIGEMMGTTGDVNGVVHCLNSRNTNWSRSRWSRDTPDLASGGHCQNYRMRNSLVYRDRPCTIGRTG